MRKDLHDLLNIQLHLLTLPHLEDQAGVVPAKAQGIGNGHLNIRLTALVGDDVQVTGGIWASW